MQSGIRIIKRDTRNHLKSVSVCVAKSDRQRERENVETVKAWVSDCQARKRQLQAAAETLVAQCVIAASERKRGRPELQTLVARPETL